MILQRPRTPGDVGAGAGVASSVGFEPGWFHADGFVRDLRRIAIFCGGFGAGKTEVAVNFSLRMRELGRRVSIADLDIVNLYFRSREVREQLRSRGINVIVPGGALADADLPIIVPEVKGAIEGRGSHGQRQKAEVAGVDDEGPGGDHHQGTEVPGGQSPNDDGQGTKDRETGPVVVLDLGGDPAGARVMASIAEGMRPEDYSGFFVLNSRRPFTATVAAAESMMASISASARIHLDRIVINSHLVDETTAAVVEEGIALGEALARKTGAGIAFVAVQRDLLGRFDAERCPHPVMVLDRLMLKPWEPSNWLGKYKIQ
jgi:hypothetical protein